MSSVMFENILKELSNLVSENDLHVSQVSVYQVQSSHFLYHLYLCLFHFQLVTVNSLLYYECRQYIQ